MKNLLLAVAVAAGSCEFPETMERRLDVEIAGRRADVYVDITNRCDVVGYRAYFKDDPFLMVGAFYGEDKNRNGVPDADMLMVGCDWGSTTYLKKDAWEPTNDVCKLPDNAQEIADETEAAIKKLTETTAR